MRISGQLRSFDAGTHTTPAASDDALESTVTDQQGEGGVVNPASPPVEKLPAAAVPVLPTLAAMPQEKDAAIKEKEAPAPKVRSARGTGPKEPLLVAAKSRIPTARSSQNNFNKENSRNHV